MASPFALLKCVGKAVLKAALKAIPLGEAVVELAGDAYAAWSKEKDEDKRRAEVQALAQAPVAEVNAQVAEVVNEIAASQPESVRQTVTNYLTLLPGAIHRSLRRPADPSGKTVPPQLPLSKAEDLIPLLPPRLPRFKPGDKPLPGVDWELVELLGVGGFGEVWKARNPYFGSVAPVALKFCLDTAVAGALRHEAAVLNRVMQQGKHPGIVPLLHTYLGADPPCLEYEFVGGGDLAGLIRDSRSRGGSPVRQAALVVHDLANVVGIAHRLSPAIVHRDLKPANILVQRTGDGKLTFRITDFGIGSLVARQVIEEATRHGTTASLFLPTALQGSYTLLYASPQQMQGQRPDPRDDVYSLGVIWHQLLTGNLATGKPGGGKWRLRLAERGLTPKMADLLDSCFEDDPSDRPADGAVLAEQLKVALDRGELPPPPSPRPPPPPSLPPPPPPPDWLRQGKEYSSRGSWNQAVAGLTEAIKLDSTLALAYALRGAAYANLGKPDDGLTDCNKAIELDPKLALAYAYRGGVRAKKEDYEEAIADCDRAVELAPEEAEVYRVRGAVYAMQDELDQAAEDFDEAIQLDPNLAMAYYNRGLVACRKSDYDAASEALAKAIELDSDFVDAYYQRGMAYCLVGKADSAIVDLDVAIRLDPKNGKAFNFRGLAYSGKENYQQALADHTEAIKLDPTLAAAYSNRGEVHRKNGSHDEAIADFNEAIRVNSAEALAFLYRGFAYKAKGQHERAVADFKEAIRLDPDQTAKLFTKEIPFHQQDAEYYYYRGLAYDKNGDPTRADKDFTKAKQLGLELPKKVAPLAPQPPLPSEAAALLHEGKKYAAEWEEQKAIEALTKAIESYPQFALAYACRGDAYGDFGKNDEGLADCNEAIRLDPNLALAYAFRGYIRNKKGDYVGAAADYEKAGELAPKEAEVSRVRGAVFDQLVKKAKSLSVKGAHLFTNAARLAAAIVAQEKAGTSVDEEDEDDAEDEDEDDEDVREQRQPSEIITNSLGMKFARIPPGTFLMGSPVKEKERAGDELPHRVTLTKGFYLGVHPVTQAQWEAVMGSNPARFQGNDRPVEMVSWEDCQEFCERLGANEGKPYRLPTEAEWEYACRAGTPTPFSFGRNISTDQVNYDGNAPYYRGRKGLNRKETTPVGSFPPNNWGLYDLHGNVFEWCEDWYGSYPRAPEENPKGLSRCGSRVARGGAWFHEAARCRSARRFSFAPNERRHDLGFRVCVYLGADEGVCPQCGFKYAWDGNRCNHCNFGR